MNDIVQRISQQERRYVQDVLDSSFKSSSGAKYMTKLESLFSEKFGTKYAISFVNGTATMHAALEAAGIGPGDEVIVPPLTMASTSLAVLHSNATPVFADINPDTFLIDAKSIEKLITERTKAIITVALYGLSPDMKAILDIAATHHLLVIEDNAQAFLSYYNGKLVGTFGHCASFSFQSSKHMTSGEGGIVITDDEEYAVKIRKFAGLGYKTLSSRKAKITKEEIQDPGFERHDCLGWNYRMPEICCAVALGQLENIDKLVEIRVKSAEVLREAVASCSWLVPQSIPENCKSSYWSFVCKLDINRVSWGNFRKKFMEYGGHAFYGAWQLTYLEPLFLKRLFGHREKFIGREYAQGLCPVAEIVQPRLVQFKTNYWNVEEAFSQAEILQRTIQHFD